MAGNRTALDAGGIVWQREGNGPPVVLLHCLGVDHNLWRIAASGLERDFTLWSYDLPGHGESKVPGGAYTIEDLSAQLLALMDRVKLAHATIAGISLGGLIAQCFAADHPARVAKLVLIDTTPRYTEELRRMWGVRAQQAREHGVASLTPGLLDIWFTKDFAAKDPPAVRYVREAFARCPGEGYALACEALATADLRERAARIAAPTLVLCGEQDIPSFQDSARWLAANIKDARLGWLSSARHASILEQPDSFRKALGEFLA